MSDRPISASPPRNPTNSAFAKIGAVLQSLPPAYYLLVVLLLIAPLLSATLTKPTFLLVILKQSAPLGVAVLAQALVMRVRSIDLSVGGVMALSLYLASSGVMKPYPAFFIVLAPFVIGIAVGLLNGFLIAYVRASAVIATLSVSVMSVGLIQYLSGSKAPGTVVPWIRVITNGQFLGVSWSVWIWLVLSILVAVALRTLTFGKYFRAVGDSPRAAQISGIPHAKTVFTAHVFAGLLTGFAALLQVSALGVGTVEPGLDVFMNALAATILGGVTFGSDKGGVAGPFVAVVAFTFLFAMLTVYGLQEPGKLIVQGLIIALAAITYGMRSR